MTLATKYMPDHYTIGAAPNRYFPISFDFLSASHIKVVITDQVTGANLLLAQGADFSVSGTTVQTVAQHPTGDRVTIYLNMPNLQGSDYLNMGRLNLEVLEEDLDYAALARQVLESDIGYLGTGLDISNALPQDLLESCEDARDAAAASAISAESNADAANGSAAAAAASAQEAQDIADGIGAETGVKSITAGTGIELTGTAEDPIISATGGGVGGGQVDEVVAGTNVTVDNTDPTKPIVSASAGGGGIPDDDSVSTIKLQDNAVTNAKMADNAIDTAEIASNAVTNAKIADDAVQAAQIADGAVINSRLGTSAVTAAKIASSAVETAKIKDLAVTAAKLANGAVTADKIPDGSISRDKLTEPGVRSVTGDSLYLDGDIVVVAPQFMTGQLDEKAFATWVFDPVGSNRQDAATPGCVIAVDFESNTNVAGDGISIGSNSFGVIKKADGSNPAGGEVTGRAFFIYKEISGGQWWIYDFSATPGTTPTVSETAARVLFDSVATTLQVLSQKNVDTVIDGGQGVFTLGFDTTLTSEGNALPSSYTWAGSAESDNTSKGTFTVSAPEGGQRTTDFLRINVVNEGGNLKDSLRVSVHVFPAGDW